MRQQANLNRFVSGLLCVISAVLFSGCAPVLSVRINTQIRADHTTNRKVGITVRPSKQLPTQKVKLKDYLELPHAEDYEIVQLTPESALFANTYTSPTAIRPEFSKYTPNTDLLSSNRIHFRSADLILLEVIDYQEIIGDIITRAGGEKALRELTTFALDVAFTFARETYAADYDLSALEKYLRREFPQTVSQMYASLWEARRARRGGIEFTRERDETERILETTALRHGIITIDPATGKRTRLDRKALIAFVRNKLNTLTKPKQNHLGSLGDRLLSSSADRRALLAVFEAHTRKRFGSMQVILKKIDPIIPRAFGAYLGSQWALRPTNPRVEFQARVEMPGHIVQTNGLRDIDGRILWTFTGEDAALSGYNMWARSLVLRAKMIEALHLVNFPGRIQNIERFYRELRPLRGGRISPRLVKAFSDSVAVESLAPLIALSKMKPDPKTGTDARAIAAAGGVVKMLKTFIKKPAAPPELQPKIVPPPAKSPTPNPPTKIVPRPKTDAPQHDKKNRPTDDNNAAPKRLDATQNPVEKTPVKQQSKNDRITQPPAQKANTP